MGVNFSVFGRKDVTFQSVKKETPIHRDNIVVTVSDQIYVGFTSGEDIPSVRIELFDILGKPITSKEFGWINKGKNLLSFQLPNSPSGTYILRLSGDNFIASKALQIIR
jgi:hypothetical protein